MANPSVTWHGGGMITNKLTLTGHLARAARALVEMSAADTAEAAGLSEARLRDFENSRASLSPHELEALVLALEQLGAFFIHDGTEGRGHGVRLKFSTEKTRRVETWEGEGGLTGLDDV